MGAFLRVGNWAVAKYVRLLFLTEHLSDVGCTYRLLRREVVGQIVDQLEIGGSQLGPELMLRTLLSGARVVEVPVNYMPRVGTSSVTGDLRKAVVLGLQMIALITRIRLRTLGRGARPRLRTASAATADRLVREAPTLLTPLDGLAPAGEPETTAHWSPQRIPA